MSGLVLRCIEAARRPRFGARFGAWRRPVSDSSSLPEDRLDRRCEDLGIIVCDVMGGGRVGDVQLGRRARKIKGDSGGCYVKVV